jgi:hypothetical protein
MAYWNHRVIQQTLPNGELWYGIHEVFYNADGSIYAYTEKPVGVSGDNVDELREYIEWTLKGLDKPVLVAEEVVFVDRALEDAE